MNEDLIVDAGIVEIPYDEFKFWVAFDEKIRLEELASIGLVPVID